MPKTGGGQIGVCKDMMSLRASAQDFRGNPPVEWNQVTITTKKSEFPVLVGTCRNIVRLTGGLPHQRARWFAMTGNLERTLSNTNLSK